MVQYYNILGKQVGSHYVSPGPPPSLHPLALSRLCKTQQTSQEERETLTPRPSFQLAIATLTTLFGGSYAFIGGGGKKTTATPPINASTPDEADFIKYITPRPHPSCEPEEHAR